MFLAPTPTDRLTDRKGRPYFLWDVDLTLDEWRERLTAPDLTQAGYWLARGLRDAKPDDLVVLVGWDEIARLWSQAEPHVGRRREFWRWWLQRRGHEV